MKEELTRYRRGDVIVARRLDCMLILDVDPITKLKSSPKDRYVEYMLGHMHTKNEEMKNSSIFVIESESNNVVLSIDTSKRYRATIHELTFEEIAYLGHLTDDKMDKFNKFI